MGYLYNIVYDNCGLSFSSLDNGNIQYIFSSCNITIFFGIIIIGILETKYTLVITDNAILDEKKTILLQDIKSYYICNYGRKAFIFRITMLDNQQRFYISPEVEKKEMIIEFFKSCPKKQNFTDKLLLLYPFFLFLVYGIAILIFSINL